jgi:hypothetical protein
VKLSASGAWSLAARPDFCETNNGMPITSDDLALLARCDTPTISNLIKILKVRFPAMLKRPE